MKHVEHQLACEGIHADVFAIGWRLLGPGPTRRRISIHATIGGDFVQNYMVMLSLSMQICILLAGLCNEPAAGTPFQTTSGELWTFACCIHIATQMSRVSCGTFVASA